MAGKTIVIAIAGASGSGKSSVARALASRIGTASNVAVLNEDAYYHLQNDRTVEQRKLTNYDHPDSIDETLLVEHLLLLKAGKTVDVPVYDYELHDRSESTINLGPCDVLIVEGILLLHRKAVREVVDLSVFVDVPEEVCLQRRIERDIAERGRTRESVIAQYEKTVVPMFRKFVLPSKEYADYVVQNVDDVTDAVDSIAAALKKMESQCD